MQQLDTQNIKTNFQRQQQCCLFSCEREHKIKPLISQKILFYYN